MSSTFSAGGAARRVFQRPQFFARPARSGPRGARRPYSSVEPPPPSPSPSAPPSQPSSGPSSTQGASAAAVTAEKTVSRFDRVHSRLPRFLQRYTSALRSAPASHVAGFLILHEITAVVPLIGFGYYFYRAEQLPWFAEGAWFDQGVRRFGKYFKKKGWLGKEEQERLEQLEIERGQSGDGSGLADGQTNRTRRAKWWGRGEDGVHLVTSVAAAYVLTKALLPLRLVLSVWGTPLFARTTIVPFTARIRAMFRKKT